MTNAQIARNRIAARAQLAQAHHVNMYANTAITRAHLFAAIERMNAANAAWAIVVAARAAS